MGAAIVWFLKWYWVFTVACVGGNLALGILNIHYHFSVYLRSINFVCAGIAVASGIRMWIARKRYEASMAEREREVQAYEDFVRRTELERQRLAQAHITEMERIQANQMFIYRRITEHTGMLPAEPGMTNITIEPCAADPLGRRVEIDETLFTDFYEPLSGARVPFELSHGMYPPRDPYTVPSEARTKARRNLARVMKLTGAKFHAYGLIYFNVGPKRFYLAAGWMSDGTRHTCWSGMNCPWEEQFASALLLLKHNPTLFDFWAANHGTFRA